MSIIKFNQNIKIQTYMHYHANMYDQVAIHYQVLIDYQVIMQHHFSQNNLNDFEAFGHIECAVNVQNTLNQNQNFVYSFLKFKIEFNNHIQSKNINILKRNTKPFNSYSNMQKRLLSRKSLKINYKKFAKDIRVFKFKNNNRFNKNRCRRCSKKSINRLNYKDY